MSEGFENHMRATIINSMIKRLSISRIENVKANGISNKHLLHDPISEMN
jgi:hypothetical protein